MIINIFVAVTMIMGIGMPDNEEDLKTTYYWKIMYLVPIPISIIVLVLALFVYKHDSVNFHVERD